MYLLGSCASDRNIVLYDMRQSTALKKVMYVLKNLVSVCVCFDRLVLQKELTILFCVSTDHCVLRGFLLMKLS